MAHITEDKDPAVNPKHYTDLGEYSPVHVVEKWGLGYHLGQTIKYIGRAGHKEGVAEIQDLKKALWYLDRKISTIEEKQWLVHDVKRNEDDTAAK